MADDHLIGADEVAGKQFATSFRGFDQYEVRAFLAQLAAELAALHERERALRERLARAEERPEPRPVEGDDLEAQLGAETARVLHAAREAATEIRARAEESVARLLREANDEATRSREEAETLLARRTQEAEAEASAVLAEAQRQGREMVAEAQAVRERVLKDLARRKRVATAQLEQLGAGRARLLEALDAVARTAESATRELAAVEVDAPDDAPAAEPEPEPVAASEPESAGEPEAAGEPESAPPAEAQSEQEAPADDAEEDRRSSSLRLLRRKPEAIDLPRLEDDIEGVRIIRPETATDAPALRPVPVLREPEFAAVEPEPEPEVVEPEPEPEPEVAEIEAEALESAGAAPVDDLFARLRADRAVAVAQAEEVLGASVALAEREPEAGPSTEAVDAEPEPAPAASADDLAFERRDAAVEPAERALTRVLKRALADEQNEVLDALRRLRGTPTIEVLLPAADDHGQRFTTAAAEHLRAAAQVGGDVDAAGPVATALGTEISEDLRFRLGRVLDAGSDDEEALVEAISASYREWKTAKAEPLARHLVAAAYAGAAYAVAGDGPLRWAVDPAEGGCPDCDDNALAGPTTKGQPYPTGQLHPPAHTGCRCLVLPAG